MDKSYVGTRWHKCDLHLHTPASLCFRNRDVTPEQWVQEALDKGLDCVAVTDHNTNKWIDKIQDAARETPLTVFPGVEITCSDAKVHLLILFDKDKIGQDVYDFLIKLGIERDEFGQQEAHTNKSIEEVAKIAHERGAIVIPAHIDEFNGICQVGNKILKDFLDLPMINAVQVVHKCIMLEAPNPAISKILENYYGTIIGNDRMRDWKNAVKESKSRNKTILTFSDNPHEAGDSRHGLWGMGRRFTWIKMEKEPSLEGLRQAFLSPQFRIKNDFDCPEGQDPHVLPQQWIKKLIIKNTEITDPETSLEIDFSPQLTTIIGGRGSGKSTILRFIRCLFQNKIDELAALGEKTFVFKDFADFFQFPKGGAENGVLKEGTAVQLYFHRHGVDYRIEYNQKSKKEKELSIYRYDSIKKDYIKDKSEGLADLFEFDIFSQKQVYDIGSKTNSLRNRIDSEVPEIAAIKFKLEEIRNQYYEKSTEVRSIQKKVARKARLKTEIADLETRQRDLFKGNELLKEREKYEAQELKIENFKKAIDRHIEIIDDAIENFILPDLTEPDEHIDDRIEKILKNHEERLKKSLGEIEKKKDELDQIIKSLSTEVNSSPWKNENEESRQKLEATKQELVENGFSLDDIQKVSDDLKIKKGQLEAIESEESKLERSLKQKELLQKEFFDKRKTLTTKRKNFLSDLLNKSSVKAKVSPYRDGEDFEFQLRRILNTDRFVQDFNKLKERLLNGNPEVTCRQLVKDIFKYRETEDQELFKNIDGRLLSTIKGLDGQQLDDLDLLAPEDEIIIQYKPNQSSKFKPISNLSPGQKTASILTILLTHKDTPLILDQPEDDLDSFLIYDLIVEQLKKSKEFRQVIVVSHNANVPVNGDSEHIIIMNSESKHVEKLEEGSIDKTEVKDFVLKVMEGGKDAFDYRSKRYKIT